MSDRGSVKELFLAVTDLGFNFVKQGDVPPHLMDHEYEIHLEKKERVKEAYRKLRSERTGYE